MTNLTGETNTLYENHGGGIFEDATSRHGLGLHSFPATGFRVGWFDVDNDGDIDILISNNNGPVRLLRNDLRRKRSWIMLRVVDDALGRDAIGARVRLTLHDGRILTRYVRADGSYLSASDPRVHFAWPENLRIRSLQVLMPDGCTRPIDTAATGTISTVRIDAGAGQAAR